MSEWKPGAVHYHLETQKDDDFAKVLIRMSKHGGRKVIAIYDDEHYARQVRDYLNMFADHEL